VVTLLVVSFYPMLYGLPNPIPSKDEMLERTERFKQLKPEIKSNWILEHSG
jgi:hypothetical protein